jgi:hypothetical protein
MVWHEKTPLLAWIKVRSKGKWQSPILEVAEKLWRGLELMWAKEKSLKLRELSFPTTGKRELL